MMKKTIVLKKTASLILALLMIVSTLAVLPFGASAETPKGWTDSDTANNIYYIATAADMKSFQSTSAAQAAGAKVYLTADIDMSGVTDWAPIGNFYGSFDGQNHTISGLKCTLATGNNAAGLFKCLYSGGSVQNLIVDSWTVTVSGNWSGLLIGTVDYGDTKLENIHVKNSSFSATKNNNFVGALFGRGTTLTSSNGKVSVTNCSVIDTTITTGGHSAGALAGDFDKATANATVSNCYSNATISANKNVGGLVGYLVNGSCTIEKSVFAGTISPATTTAVGGLVGLAGTSSAGKLTMNDCAFIGTIGEADTNIALVGDATNAVSANLVRCVAAENFDAQKETLLANGWVTTEATMPVGEDRVAVIVPDASLQKYFACPIPTTDIYYQKKANGDGTVDIRFVAVINDLSYANVGFNVQATRGEGDGAQISQKITKTTTTVYTSVTALGDNVTAKSLGGQYIYVIEITNVDVATYAHSFDVSAFVTLENGTVLEAATQTATVAKAS